MDTSSTALKVYSFTSILHLDQKCVVVAGKLQAADDAKGRQQTEIMPLGHNPSKWFR